MALLGRNGMGKTTTIRSIMGLTPPRKGSILYNGREIVGMQPHKIARLGIGLVPQGRMIFSSLSVTENLKMAARTAGKKDPWTLEKVFTRLSEAGREAQEQGQSPLRRRAADAHHRPGAHDQSRPHAVRRALRGAWPRWWSTRCSG